MSNNPLQQLTDLGQSLWLDYISRDLIESGELGRLIEQDWLRGLTSNPTIFQEAISAGSFYDRQIRELAACGKTLREIYDAATVLDVQRAADLFRPLYDSTNGADGYVSLEANPHLARHTSGTMQEVRRLWAALDRPNVLIKVPATTEGIPAIQQLISEGININVTLLFSLARYRQVAEAYLAGLEKRAQRGLPLQVASVASFFVSRIDSKLDPVFESYAGKCGESAVLAGELHGQVAIACAKIAYQMFQEIFGSRRFWELSKQGACRQRLLWGSTGTKNPEYSDIKYVEALIGPDTVNTVPLATLAAYRDHGSPQARIQEKVDYSAWVLEVLPLLDINLEDCAGELELEGAEKFSSSFDDLLKTLEHIVSEKLSRAA